MPSVYMHSIPSIRQLDPLVSNDYRPHPVVRAQKGLKRAHLFDHDMVRGGTKHGTGMILLVSEVIAISHEEQFITANYI